MSASPQSRISLDNVLLAQRTLEEMAAWRVGWATGYQRGFEAGVNAMSDVPAQKELRPGEEKLV